MSSTPRQRIERGFYNFGLQVDRLRWPLLVALIVLVVALASQISKLKLDTSTEGFLHPDDATLIDYNGFREQFGRDELILVTISADEVFAHRFLKSLKALHYDLRDNLPYLDDITSLINARNTRGEAQQLIVEDLLEQWPESDEALTNLKRRALSNTTYRNMLLSEDGTITTIVLKTDAYVSEAADDVDVMAGFDDAETEITATEPNRQSLSDAQNSEIVSAVREITGRHMGEQFTVHLAGSPVVTDVLKRTMQTNMKRFMLTAIGAIAIILLLLFRRLSGVFLPLLIVILSLISTLGLMGLAGIAFKLPTQILPSFLLAVGVGASVHLLSIFYRHLQQNQGSEATGRASREDKREAAAYALGHSGLAIVMTSLTTAAGLASFSGAEVAPISDLGKIAAIGILLSLIFTLVLLPILLSLTPLWLKPIKAHHKLMDRALIKTADIATHRYGVVLGICAVVIIIGLIGATQVRFSHKPFEWLPESNPVRQATDFVNERMRGASTVEVVVDSGKVNGFFDPQLMAGLESLGREVEQIDRGELYVGKTLSLADILKEINRALNENRSDHYSIPKDRELVAQEFLLFENSGSDDLEDFVDSQFSKARFTAKMPWVDGIFYNDFIEDLRDRFQRELGDDVEITVTGLAALLGRTMHATIVSMTNSYLLAVGVITIMMILLIGDLRIGLISMIPNLAPIIITLGIMGWFGLPLDLFTMLIGSIAIGLAVDDTIHFMHNYRRYHHETGDVHQAVRQTLLTTGRAMLVTTVVLSVGFYLYMFSELSNLVNFGLLTGSTIILALLADFFLAPALMALAHRKHLIPDDSDY